MPQRPSEIQTWQMTKPWTKNRETGETTEGKLTLTQIPTPPPESGEALVEIAGCGVCHTDLGYFYDGVPTVTKPPLTLGHEISGVVVSEDESLNGKEVIIPAVLPCNSCAICKAGRGNRCLSQKMPGNSLGIYGGFSSHIPVPAADLCIVKDRRGFQLPELAVIADAVTTPYQACVRGEIKKGDNVVVVGITGGVGSYVGQMAKAFGADTVIGIARNPEKLERALKYGTDYVINSTDKDAKTVRDEFRNICKTNGLPSKHSWTIFEVTGTSPGQKIALTILPFTSKLVVIGFGLQRNEFSISRLMALDSDIIGTWGCLPQYYPKVLQMVLDGTIKIKPFTEIRSMSRIKEVFKEAHSKKLDRRVVLTPDFQ